jgi:hypothetical protein
VFFLRMRLLNTSWNEDFRNVSSQRSVGLGESIRRLVNLKKEKKILFVLKTHSIKKLNIKFFLS